MKLSATPFATSAATCGEAELDERALLWGSDFQTALNDSRGRAQPLRRFRVLRDNVGVVRKIQLLGGTFSDGAAAEQPHLRGDEVVIVRRLHVLLP